MNTAYKKDPFYNASKNINSPRFSGHMPLSAKKAYDFLHENDEYEEGKKNEDDPGLCALVDAIHNLSHSKILDVLKINHTGFCLSTCFVLARLNFYTKMQQINEKTGKKEYMYIPKKFNHFSYEELLDEGLYKIAIDVAFGYSFNTMNNKKKNLLQEHHEFVEEIAKYVVDALKSELQLYTHLQDRLADRHYYRFPIFEISERIFKKLQAYRCQKNNCAIDLRNFYLHFLIYLTAYPYLILQNGNIQHAINQDSGRVNIKETTRWWNPFPNENFFDAINTHKNQDPGLGALLDTIHNNRIFTIILCPSMLKLCSLVTTFGMNKLDRIQEYSRILPILRKRCSETEFSKDLVWMLKATASHFPEIAENPKICPYFFFDLSYGLTCGIEFFPIISDCLKAEILQYSRTSWGDHQLTIILALMNKKFVHNYVKFFKETQANHKYDIGFCNTNKKIKRKAFGYPPLSDNFFDRKHMLKRLQKIQKNNGNFELGSKNPLSISVKEIPKNIRNEIIFEEQGSTYASVLHLMRLGGLDSMTYINDFALTRENDSIDLHIKIPKFEKKVLWNSSKVYDYLLLQALQDKNFREQLGNEKILWMTKEDADKAGLVGDINITKVMPSTPLRQLSEQQECAETLIDCVGSLTPQMTPPQKKQKT